MSVRTQPPSWATEGSLRRRNRLDTRKVQLDGDRAALVFGSQCSACAFKGRGVSARQYDDETFREQLASRLESRATIRASHERDACIVVPHGSILTASTQANWEASSQRRRCC
jgi:hypothetical protein